MKHLPGYFEFKNGTVLSYWCQLIEVIHPQKFNWITFQFFNFEVERDRYTGTAEVTLTILGCGISLVWEAFRKTSKDKPSKKYVDQTVRGFTFVKELAAYKKGKLTFLNVYKDKPTIGTEKINKVRLYKTPGVV